MAKLIAKLQEKDVNAEAIIAHSDEPNIYLYKTVWYDDEGKKEGESVKWHRLSAQELRHLLTVHFGMTSGQIDALLGDKEKERQAKIAQQAIGMLYS